MEPIRHRSIVRELFTLDSPFSVPSVVNCPFLPCRFAAVAAVALLLVSSATANAQLRPYEPFEWTIFDGESRFVAGAGAAWLPDQRASLAGVEGSLLELGRFAATVRTGRVAFTAEGVVQRFLDVESSFATPDGGAVDAGNDSRRDTGDFIVASAVRLTPPDRPALALVRFGTRLPTTDNRVGLERDATDFFATLGGRLDRGALRAFAELGVGIHGTRRSSYEQSDALIYLLGVGLRDRPVVPTLLVVGHADGLADRTIRGNEELAEARLRLRSNGRVWLQGELIRGLTDFSPGWGLTVQLGTTR